MPESPDFETPDVLEGEVFVAPASFAQQRLWLLDRILPGLPTYNLPLGLRLYGDLDAGRLARALEEMVARHETLRTAIGVEDDLPVQLISAWADLALPRVDLSALPGDRAEAEMRRCLGEQAALPFDLGTAPLARAALFRLAPREHALGLTLHHAIGDAASVEVLVRELLEVYDALGAGREPRLPDLPIQYADYAAWQRQWLQGETLELKLAPWRRRLEGAPTELRLPTDRPRSMKVDPRGEILLFAWSPETREALERRGRESGATSFMTALAAFQALLARHAGQLDLLVGSPVANRSRVQTENVVGFFSNLLVLRGDLRDDPSFRDHLARVREVTVEAFDYEDLPFDKMVEELRPERRLDQNPLFQVAFGYQKLPLPLGRHESGLEVEAVAFSSGTAKFEITLLLNELPNGWVQGFWEYSSALFDRATIARMDAHLETLLADALAHPELRVSELALLTEPERHQVAAEWAGAPTKYPREATVHALFAAQAARTPEAVALEYPGGTTTYAELDRATDRLAAALRRRGAAPGDRVGVLLERGPEIPEAFLAILKAGAAYVPLDPEYPEERLAFLLEDAGIRLVLTREELRGKLPADWRADARRVVIRDEAVSEEAGPAPAGDLAVADSVAYVLYTSGSTGRPKGVAVPHRAVVRLVVESDYVRFTPEDRVAQASNPSFDATTFEVWGALLNGGRLVLLSRDLTLSSESYARTLASGAVTALFMTPSLFSRVSLHDPTAFRRVRHLILGGEAMDPPRVAAVLAAGAPERLLNGYGPTESTTFALWWKVDRIEPGRGVPIGRPLANTTALLLDAAFQPVPAGVAGEVCLGGDGLALGYIGRPELTAERFVPSPRPEDGPGGRLYRTGDLGRHRNDGAVEFLGRRDGQVKIRGFRVETGEVETALGTCPGVREVAVVARPLAGTELALVAYYSPERNASPLPQQLREHLRSRLPEFMVPGAFVRLDELPKNANGKVDRRALPAPSQEGLGGTGFQPPRTPVEEVLASLWAGVLRLDPAQARVGVDDNFFDLGGHSLTASSLTSQIRSAFRVELPTRAIFEAPVLADLADRVEELLAQAQGLDLPPVAPAPHKPGEELPLSYSQRRLWFADQMAGGESPFYNVAATLSMEGDLKVPALAATLTEISRRHEALRTTFREGAAGSPVQVVHPAGPVALPLIDLSDLPPGRAQAESLRVARQEERRPFSLVRGPLLRLALLRLPAGSHALVLALHHVVSDGWSLEVLVREMGALYAAALEGRPSPLPELPVQYPDFALWQRRHLAGPQLDRQLDYWKGKLAGVPLDLELPADRPRPARQRYAGGTTLIALPEALPAALEGLARQAGATLFMTLFAGYAALLHRYTGQDDFLLGTAVANRNRAEIEGLIGFFVNLLPLRADFSGGAGQAGFAALLARARETALDAYTHQDLPFERLVEELQPNRDLTRHPLFQASIAHTVVPWHGLELPALRFGALHEAGGEETEIFGLSLQVVETGYGLQLHLHHDVDLFDDSTARRMGDHLAALLAAVVADPRRPLADLPLLAPAERHQLAVEWPGRPLAAGTVSVIDLFEATVDRSPAALALLWEGGELSYEELDRRANRLAHHLRAMGIGTTSREDLVALRLEEGQDFALAILAVFKAGAAYVPIDPTLPAERQDWMLAASGSRAVITRSRLGAGAGGPGTVPAVHLDRDRAAIAGRSAERPGIPLDPRALAYVLYTSGSTGTPKGVQLPHGALALHTREAARWTGLQPGDRMLQLASFSFDLSLHETFPVWAAGATVVSLRPRTAIAPADLLRALSDYEIAVACLSVAPWLQAVREWAVRPDRPAVTPPPKLRWVAIGGDASPAGALQLWRQTPLGGIRLWQDYGLTETTIINTVYRAPEEGLGADPVRESFRLPIGRPLPEVALYLVGPDDGPVPLGAPGEICLAGDSLARGYLGRPDLTAAVFVPAPWGVTPGGRMYRTGDRARYRPDGQLEFLGRRDQQVKLRGFRIEPGEIEAVLLGHPGIASAAVALLDGGTPEARLVAWVAGRDGAAPPAAELRTFLRDRLPAYMVPAAFVELDALPLNSSGKLDKAALPLASAAAGRPAEPEAVAAAIPAPEPVPAGPAPISEFRQSLEGVLSDLWSEVLGVESIGREENFFDNGGHSMLLAVLKARIQQELGVDLPLVELFQYPTVAAQAERLEAELSGLAPVESVADPLPDATSGRGRPLPEDAEGSTAIAIVGFAGRFPGARNLEELWAHLAGGAETITFLAPDGEGWEPGEKPGSYRVPAGGLLPDDPTMWDAAFFGFSDREAELMDPQHRLFLECAWEALEDAGYAAGRLRGKVGVFGGYDRNYYHRLIQESGAARDAVERHMAMLGNERDSFAVRVSFKLGLEGPSMTVQTGCSTSFSAIHLACQCLLAGDCGMALAGSANVGPFPRRGYLYDPTGFLSPDGHCRSFDAAAGGTVDSDGAGIVVLKRLADARADGDAIRAVILATAMNNDGSERGGFQMPRPATRARVVSEAIERAGIPADTLTYIEASGNGIPLSDSLEMTALIEAFRGRTQPCAIGSVKSNIGHPGGASGIAGLAKTLVALEHRQIPPTLHFERFHPDVDPAPRSDTPFFVDTRLRDWTPPPGVPRRAGICSFGVGGGNVHVIVEEAPALPASDPPAEPWQVLPLSARTPEALQAAARRLADWLARRPDLTVAELADVAFTLQTGRKTFEHRLAVLARGAAEAHQALAAAAGSAEGGARLQAAGGDRPSAAPEAAARRWLAGEEVDWRLLHAGEARRRTALPTYPFERRRHWVDLTALPGPADDTAGLAAALDF